MPKFNTDIKVILTNDKESLSFYAFNGEKEPFKGIYNRLIHPKRFIYPIARIYYKNELKHSYIQGYEVNKKQLEKKWYGADISAFKIKLILKNGDRVGPFYSNSHLPLEQQYNYLIEHYLKKTYERKFISALVFYIQENEEILAAQALFKNKQLIINKKIEL